MKAIITRPGKLWAPTNGCPAGTKGMVRQEAVPPFGYTFHPLHHRDVNFKFNVEVGTFTSEGHGIGEDTLNESLRVLEPA